MPASNYLFNESFCKIWLDSKTQILHAKWLGFLSLDEVKQGCAVLTRNIRERQLKQHLSDHTELKVLSREVQSYLTQKWFPEAEQVGLRKVAALVSENVFAKATVDKVNHEAQVGELVIGTFNSMQACEDWLLGVPA